MTERRDVTKKTTEQNLIVGLRIGKLSRTDNNRVRSRRILLKLTMIDYEATRDLSATAELFLCLSETPFYTV